MTPLARLCYALAHAQKDLDAMLASSPGTWPDLDDRRAAIRDLKGRITKWEQGIDPETGRVSTLNKTNIQKVLDSNNSIV